MLRRGFFFFRSGYFRGCVGFLLLRLAFRFFRDGFRGGSKARIDGKPFVLLHVLDEVDQQEDDHQDDADHEIGVGEVEGREGVERVFPGFGAAPEVELHEVDDPVEAVVASQ